MNQFESPTIEEVDRRIAVLNGVMANWPREYAERPVRSRYEQQQRALRRYLKKLHPSAPDKATRLAFLVTRMLDEFAVHLGSDRRLALALWGAITGDIKPASPEAITLAEVSGQWGEETLRATAKSSYEETFQLGFRGFAPFQKFRPRGLALN